MVLVTNTGCEVLTFCEDEKQQFAEILAKKNIDAEIVNARFLKPLDKETILKSVEKTKKAVTIEDGLIEGGLRN